MLMLHVSQTSLGIQSPHSVNVFRKGMLEQNVGIKWFSKSLSGILGVGAASLMIS